MSVLEVTQLRVKGRFEDHPALLQSLSVVRGKLHTNSQFYHCIEDPTLIYILGIWPGLDAHLKFLASPERDEVLGPQESMLQFCWTVHMGLDDMSSLPLDAPILAIERLSVKGDCINAFDQAVIRHMQLRQGSHPFKVAHGWRCDAAAGSHEALIFTGWENAQAHVTFAVNQKGHSDGDSAAINGKYEEIHVHHARNLERNEA
ncbi:Nn.00g064580.m01.CDS01 [Neocucurbitaria sp. VM-36]